MPATLLIILWSLVSGFSSGSSFYTAFGLLHHAQNHACYSFRPESKKLFADLYKNIKFVSLIIEIHVTDNVYELASDHITCYLANLLLFVSLLKWYCVSVHHPPQAKSGGDQCEGGSTDQGSHLSEDIRGYGGCPHVGGPS